MFRLDDGLIMIVHRQLWTIVICTNYKGIWELLWMLTLDYSCLQMIEC